MLNPADVDYLYFVADGSGGHAFARTLDEHNRNVATWRKIKNGEQPRPQEPSRIETAARRLSARGASRRRRRRRRTLHR